MSEKLYSLYFLICPIENIVRYVGITKYPEKRYKQHLSMKKNFRKKGWILSLKEQKLAPIFKIARSGLSESIAKKMECELILMIKHIVGEKLTNLTKGGDSFPLNDSAEERKILSEKRKDFLRKNPDHVKRGKDNPWFGKSWTPERKKIQSEKTKGKNSPNYGKKFSKETKEKISQARMNWLVPEDIRRKISNSTMGSKNHFFGKNHSDETRAIMSDKKKELLKDPTKNSMYGRVGSKNPKSKKVAQISLETGEVINTFSSIAEAYAHIKPNLKKNGGSSIVAVCKGKTKSYGGFHWKYIEERGPK